MNVRNRLIGVKKLIHIRGSCGASREQDSRTSKDILRAHLIGKRRQVKPRYQWIGRHERALAAYSAKPARSNESTNRAAHRKSGYPVKLFDKPFTRQGIARF